MLIGAFHELHEGAVVGAVQDVVGQCLSALLDLGVVVDVLLEVEVVLLGVGRLGDELSVHRLDDLAQGRLDRRQQVVGGLATHVLDAGLVQAKRVAQFLGRGSHRHVDVATRGQAVYGQPLDHPHGHCLVGRPGEGLLHALGEHLGDLQHRADVRV